MNCDNFISARPSVRVHAQPGGNSSAGSLIYGGGDASGARNSPREQAPQATASGAGLASHDGELRRSTTFVVAPAAQNELLSMLKRLRLKTKKERNCKIFELLQDLKSDNTFMVNEAYDNYNALCLHNRQEYSVDFDESLKNLTADVQVTQQMFKVM